MEPLAMRRRAQTLRKNMTLEERILWYQFLKNYPIQWNRQKVFGPYVVDFYCKRLKLVIELDGSQHYEEAGFASDQKRTAYLTSLGLQVLRFSNRDIKTNLTGVCDAINLCVSQKLPLGEAVSEAD